MVIATGARGYVSYDFETSFGTGASFTGLIVMETVAGSES